jgi:hypothetical protein
MDAQRRIVFALVIGLVAAGLTTLLLVKKSSVPGDPRLEGTISLFMNECLPDELTPAQREEIDGIMSRFYANAVAGRVYPTDIAVIEDEIDMYLERGGITRLELNDFMVMVGEATRRMDEMESPGVE